MLLLPMGCILQLLRCAACEGNDIHLNKARLGSYFDGHKSPPPPSASDFSLCCGRANSANVCHGVNLHFLSLSVGAQEVLIDPGMNCPTDAAWTPVLLFACVPVLLSLHLFCLNLNPFNSESH